MNEIKNRMEESLRSTNRPGIEALIAKLEEIGFYTAPCSTANHLCREGGLAQHSLNVMEAALKLSDAMLPKLDTMLRNSIILVALCHDVGKCGGYGKPYYVPNYLKSGKLSDAKPYQRNDALCNVPHAMRSVDIVKSCMPITQDEEWAILTHGGLYDECKLFVMDHETTLSLLIHWADMWASRVMETPDLAEWYHQWRDETAALFPQKGE